MPNSSYTLSMNEIFRLRKYFEYQWKAKTKYYLHSPFVYQFYLNVLEGEDDENIRSIHSLREKLRSNNSLIKIEDYGIGESSSQTISYLEKNISVQKKYGELLYRLVKYFKSQNIIELGTSIGISSSYLALANPNAKVISLEGSSTPIELAKQHHALLGIGNIELISGNFNETLPALLKKITTPDLIFFDGNHRKDATLKYFQECLNHISENSVFVFDDIYWSKEMSEAWTEIVQHPQVTLTLNIFQFGICFFRKEKIAKENFVLRY